MVEVFVEKKPLRLDLAGGENVAEGFECVDLYAPNAPHKVDLLKFPWPWEDSSVEEIHCAHFIEHIPMAYTKRDSWSALKPTDPSTQFTAYSQIGGEGWTDLWCAFFDECWRILKSGGRMTVITPHVQSVRAFQDPTHRRFHCEANFLYLSKEWRVANKLDHYLGKANFKVSVDRLGPMEESIRHPEAQAARAAHYWNTVFDLKATLEAIK